MMYMFDILPVMHRCQGESSGGVKEYSVPEGCFYFVHTW